MSVDSRNNLIKKFQFSEIHGELFIIRDYINLIVNNYAELMELERNRVDLAFKEAFKNINEENSELAAVLIAEHEYNLNVGIIPRFLTASAVIAIWGAYESAIQGIASLVAKYQTIDLRMSDLKGDFLHRTKIYFKKVLGI